MPLIKTINHLPPGQKGKLVMLQKCIRS